MAVIALSPLKGLKRGAKRCRRKCPKGARAVCKGGFRKGGKGRRKRVCRKWVCRRRK
jgi:hypothetical protein